MARVRLLSGLTAVVLVCGSASFVPPTGSVSTAPARAAVEPSSRPAAAYRAPVEGPLQVVRAFERPATRYAAGHRGVDLGTSRAVTVLAAGSGRVRFAGTVANRGVIVILHPDGISTEYEPVAAVVSVGTQVRTGQPIGHVAGAHGTCPLNACLHWGARRAGVYFDPLTLLGRLGPIRLLPWTGP